jgi:signal transduction histidine kinase
VNQSITGEGGDLEKARVMIDAQERERQHIGQELHDNVNQILISAQLTLGSACKKAVGIPEVAELIATGRKQIAEAIAEIRKLSHELSPALGIDRPRAFWGAAQSGRRTGRPFPL